MKILVLFLLILALHGAALAEDAVETHPALASDISPEWYLVPKLRPAPYGMAHINYVLTTTSADGKATIMFNDHGGAVLQLARFAGTDCYEAWADFTPMVGFRNDASNDAEAYGNAMRAEGLDWFGYVQEMSLALDDCASAAGVEDTEYQIEFGNSLNNFMLVYEAMTAVRRQDYTGRLRR